MSAAAHLVVYLGEHVVGDLARTAGGRMRFRYAVDWLDYAQARPLSLSLPLQAEPFDEEAARPFFAGLLPEGAVRTDVARRLGLSERNEFGLLEALGGECAGAVTLLPEDEAPPSARGTYRTLTADDLRDLVETLPRRPLLAGEDGLRLSLAGAQYKLAVRLDGGTVSLPLGAAPSTHILKIPIPGLEGSVENEVFCMNLASRLGLPIPRSIVGGGDAPFYLVERYDRRRRGDQVERVHQEDFCQALGIPPELKYEQEGGPSLSRCGALLRQHSTQPAVDLRALLEWVAFNHLIGNADAHAKNLSVLLPADGPRLAPFYDLLSTEVYPELARKHAMRVGGENRADWRMERHWAQLAEELGMGRRLVARTLERVATGAQTEAEALAAEMPSPIVERVVELIARRSERILS